MGAALYNLAPFQHQDLIASGDGGKPVSDNEAGTALGDVRNGALDQQLHTLWAACTRNAIMPNLVPILSQAIPLFIDITKRALQMQSLRTHQAVVDAGRARDSEAARQAMRVHLEDNRRSIEALPDDDS